MGIGAQIAIHMTWISTCTCANVHKEKRRKNIYWPITTRDLLDGWGVYVPHGSAPYPRLASRARARSSPPLPAVRRRRRFSHQSDSVDCPTADWLWGCERSPSYFLEFVDVGFEEISISEWCISRAVLCLQLDPIVWVLLRLGEDLVEFVETRIFSCTFP